MLRNLFGLALGCLICSLLCNAGNPGDACKNGLPCDDGSCVDGNKWCDDELDCKDGSDEVYCDYTTWRSEDPNGCKDKTNLFMCESGPCIPEIGLCDGFSHCDDESDEENCVTTSSNVTMPSTPKFGSTSASPVRHSTSKPIRPAYVSRKLLAIDTGSLGDRLKQARNWLLSERRQDFGWGEETQRAIQALALSRSGQDGTGREEEMLMEKQLAIRLSIALTRNQTKPMSLSVLSLYINALMATCSNPRNFYGYDLVSTLRFRVTEAQYSRKLVTPLVYLTLCLNNETGTNDIKLLEDIASQRENHQKRIDLQASAILAASCIQRIPAHANSALLSNLVTRMLHRVKTETLPGNVYDVAVMVQALDAADQSPSDWPRMEALDFILKEQRENGSFADILATYYVLPILNHRTLLSLKDHCDHSKDSDWIPIEVLKNTKRKKITVRYALHYGNPPEVEETLQMEVAEGTHFLDIMRLAQEINPKYRFSLDNHKDSPLVYSIGDVPNDAEKGMYWILHVENKMAPSSRPTSFTSRLAPYTASIARLVPASGDRIVFWFKPL